MASAIALVFRLARPAPPEKARSIRLALAAAEASLPDGEVLEPGSWPDGRIYEAVYRHASSAMHALRALQDAVRRTSFRAAVAAGEHWSDVIRLDGRDVAPHALSIARALSTRLRLNDTTWVAFQGFGAWDEAASAAFNLTCNVRHWRSRWQRQAEQVYRTAGTVAGTAKALGLSTQSAGHRLRRAGIQHVDLLDMVIARQLDASKLQP